MWCVAVLSVTITWMSELWKAIEKLRIFCGIEGTSLWRATQRHSAQADAEPHLQSLQLYSSHQLRSRPFRPNGRSSAFRGTRPCLNVVALIRRIRLLSFYRTASRKDLLMTKKFAVLL